MPVEQDMVVKELEISQKAQFNMIEFYRSSKAWFDINRYRFYEKEHEEKVEKGKKSLKIKWRALKEVDDYSTFRIDLSISLANYEIIKEENEKLTEGKLKIRFSSRIITDYEEKWSKSPAIKFLRGVSDKFFTAKKTEMYRKELKNDTFDVYNKIKSLLNLHKFR